uniref:CUB domain-containing protein n=1 Tax=Macrostomum lignano TaxID=282301 RepID=A0A1I8FCZ1_9PLAT
MSPLIFVQVVFRDALLLIGSLPGCQLVLLHSAMKNLPLLLQQFSVIVLLINGLVLQHHQVAANSSARLVLRLISYENLGNLRISGASCDSMRVALRSGPLMLPPSGGGMRISVWIECSPGFYGRGCDVRCEPQRGCCCDSEGLLRCDETIGEIALLSPAGTKPAFPTSGPGGAGSSNGNSDNRNRDEATSVLFIAVMASSMTSIFILAVIALVAIKMCKASE